MTTAPPQAAPDGPPMLVHRLLRELEQLPASRTAVLRVVRLVDDPACGAAEVAAATSVDAALTARMLRMANSAYYGMSGRVSSASFADTVLGLETVRALAVLSAADVLGASDLPPGFATRGAATASASALLAPRVGADPAQAFCAGILHDLGTALLWRLDPSRQRAILVRASPAEPAHVLELAEYGATHASLSGQVLASWHFPDELCCAIGRHHDPVSVGASPLRRALQGGIALASLADGAVPPGEATAVAALAAAQVDRAEQPALVAQVRRETRQLTGALH
jgi:HD-like signal output (HDOD) protein